MRPWRNWIRQKKPWVKPMAENKLSLGMANLDAFAQALIDLAEHDRDILVVTSDSRGSGRVTPFAAKSCKEKWVAPKAP